MLLQTEIEIKTAEPRITTPHTCMKIINRHFSTDTHIRLSCQFSPPHYTLFSIQSLWQNLSVKCIRPAIRMITRI